VPGDRSTRIGGAGRGLEQLARYLLREPIAKDRLTRTVELTWTTGQRVLRYSALDGEPVYRGSLSSGARSERPSSAWRRVQIASAISLRIALTRAPRRGNMWAGKRPAPTTGRRARHRSPRTSLNSAQRRGVGERSWELHAETSVRLGDETRCLGQLAEPRSVGTHREDLPAARIRADRIAA
jgi:hypothetical protein